MMTDDYRVRLDAFEGPLDLLLFLIRKNEVEITNIPIASITDQYLRFLGQVQNAGSRLDIDAAGEFLVMAATLTEIKSRMLMPKPPGAGTGVSPAGPVEDPRAELVTQLLEYKRYRDAADSLERRAEEWRLRFGAGRAGLDGASLEHALSAEQELDLEDLDLVELAAAFRRIQETVNFDRLGDHQVTYDDTPIELHAQDIITRLTEREAHTGGAPVEAELKDFFDGRSRPEMVGLFLALLELVRNRKVAVRQDRTEGSILVRLRHDEHAHAETESASHGGDPAAQTPAAGVPTPNSAPPPAP